MYCKHCGKQIADDSSFCQYCGEKVIDELLLRGKYVFFISD